jgi:hypothetical protein
VDIAAIITGSVGVATLSMLVQVTINMTRELRVTSYELRNIDRPLPLISGGVRWIVGWIAIGMIMALMMAFVRSVG